MATKKSIPADEKLEKQDFDLFDALTALDKKDYGYYERLSAEQQRKFVPYMMIIWMSTVKGNKDLQGYYVMNTEYTANKYYFNENVQRHPKLQWLMLCAASPGIGKQFHQWIPHLTSKVSSLKETIKVKEAKEYFTKIYPKADSKDIQEYSENFAKEHTKKCYLAKVFPNMKIADIEVLSNFVTDKDIEQYEKDRGN